VQLFGCMRLSPVGCFGAAMIAWSSLLSSVSSWKESHWQLPLLDWDTITLAALSTALAIYLAARDRSGLPGPVALPVLGNLPGIVLSGSIDKYLDEMRQKYGDVSICSYLLCCNLSHIADNSVQGYVVCRLG